MAIPTTADGTHPHDHKAAVRVSNELLRQLCAGELRGREVPARAADRAPASEGGPD